MDVATQERKTLQHIDKNPTEHFVIWSLIGKVNVKATVEN